MKQTNTNEARVRPRFGANVHENARIAKKITEELSPFNFGSEKETRARMCAGSAYCTYATASIAYKIGILENWSRIWLPSDVKKIIIGYVREDLVENACRLERRIRDTFEYRDDAFAIVWKAAIGNRLLTIDELSDFWARVEPGAMFNCMMYMSNYYVTRINNLADMSFVLNGDMGSRSLISAITNMSGDLRFQLVHFMSLLMLMFGKYGNKHTFSFEEIRSITTDANSREKYVKVFEQILDTKEIDSFMSRAALPGFRSVSTKPIELDERTAKLFYEHLYTYEDDLARMWGSADESEYADESADERD